MLRRISKVLLTLVLALSVVTAFGFAPSQDTYALAKAKKTKVTSVKLNHKVITIKKGKTLKLKATVLPKKAAKKAKLVWKTSNKKIATVSSKGKVKAKKAGKVTITATVKGTKKKAKCTVYVGTPVKKVILNKKELTLNKGKTYTLKATLSPKKPKLKTVKYSSDNETVATVSKKGVITAVAPGTAVITAAPKDEAGKKATVTVTVNKVIEGIDWNDASKAVTAMKGGESADLGIVVTPADVSAAVTWKSSDDSKLKVENGKITAAEDASGDYTVTATAKDEAGTVKEISKVIKVTPVAVSVSTKEALVEALKNKDLKTLIIEGDQITTLDIPEGVFKTIDVLINAPKAHIENAAQFNKVTVKAISSSSYVEKAQGNKIEFFADKGKLQIAEAASATVLVGEGVNDMNLVVDGNVDKLTIDTKANIIIDGATNNSVPTEMTAQAADSKVSTSVELEVTTAVKMILGIRSGAEHTSVTAANHAATPELTGLGVIQLRYADSNDGCRMVAKNEGIPSDTIKVNVSGAVVNMDGTAASGAKVMLLPYTEELSNEQAAAKAAGAAKYSAVAGDDGAYSIAGVTAGNYYIAAQKSGFVTTVGKIAIMGNSSQSFSVQDLIMIAGSDKDNAGKLSGRLVDAVTGDPVVAGLTVLLRAGTNNVSGNVIETVTTNSEGKYAFTKALPFGQYTVQVADKRNDENVKYASTSFNTIVSSGDAVASDVGITATVSSDQVRFVLSWGKEASGASADIDSHLVGPRADGVGQFHTWYGRKRYYSDDRDYDEEGEMVYDNLYADLDRDDTDFEGPETTTIRIKTPGVYSFYVHDYTNRENADSSQMSRSSAVVDVYVGRKTYTYNMPNKTGILWYVCDYDSRTGKVTPKNEIVSWTDDESEIGLSAEERLRVSAERLQDCIDESQSMADGLTSSDIKTEGLNLIKSAKDAKTSSDKAKIDAAIDSLNEWMSKVGNAFELDESGVYTGTGFEDEANLITSAYTDEFWNDEDTEVEYRTLVIRGISETLPSDIKVNFVNKDVQSSIENADSFGAGKGFEKMLVASYAGMTRNYYISYTQEGDSGTSVDDEYVERLPEKLSNAEDLGVISAKDLDSVDVPEYGIAYKFSVDASGSYKLWSSGETDTYGELYNANQELIIDGDDGSTDNNFEIINNLEAGEVYYIVLRGYSKELSFTSGLHIAPYEESEEA